MKLEINKYIFLAIFFSLILVSYFLVKPFLTPIILACILAYMCHPMYNWFLKKLKYKSLSAAVVLIIVIIIISIPFSFFVTATINSDPGDIIDSMKTFRNTFKGDVIQANCEGRTDFICRTMNSILKRVDAPQIEETINIGLSQATDAIIKATTEFIFKIPFMILSLFVMFFLLYYLLKDGSNFLDKVKRYIPLKKHYQEKIIKSFGDITYAVIYGNIIVALVQGLVAFIGFWLFGFRNPVLLGLLTAFAGLIPLIGTGIVWLPAASFKIINGFVQGGGIAVTRGFLMLLWGALLVSTIDNVIRPKLIGTKTTLHPALILLGILGGLSFFGFVGIIVGPIILSIMLIFIDIYMKQRKSSPEK